MLFYDGLSEDAGSVSVPRRPSDLLCVVELAWNCADLGVVVPSSQNSMSPSPSSPRLTRSPFSRIMSSSVTRLSEKIYDPLAESKSPRRFTNLEMVTDQVPVLAARTRYENGAVVVALLRDAVRRPCAARFARKGQLVRRDLVAL